MENKPESIIKKDLFGFEIKASDVTDPRAIAASEAIIKEMEEEDRRNGCKEYRSHLKKGMQA